PRWFQRKLEAALMACTHTAAISVLARFRGGGGSEAQVSALATPAARLLRAYSTQVETLRRLRHGGDQYVRVDHVHVNDGGQAVIGEAVAACTRSQWRRSLQRRAILGELTCRDGARRPQSCAVSVASGSRTAPGE